MSRKTLVTALTAAFLCSAPLEQARATVIEPGTRLADVLVLVDESGSMSGEHEWLPGMIADLHAALAVAGVSGSYGLVGFGANNPAPQTHTGFTTVAGFAAAAENLVASGGFEDGYAAIVHGLGLARTPGSALNVILVTDEDRDSLATPPDFSSVLGLLQSEGALLNAVVNVKLKDQSGNRALGLNSVNNTGQAFRADGSGGFTVSTGGAASDGAGATIANYVNLAIATGGAAWDLNKLREGGLEATSFTKAFVSIKVQEIVDQGEVPEPAALAMLALGFVGLRATRRFKRAA